VRTVRGHTPLAADRALTAFFVVPSTSSFFSRMRCVFLVFSD
jgi:hypothetical protein